MSDLRSEQLQILAVVGQIGLCIQLPSRLDMSWDDLRWIQSFDQI